MNIISMMLALRDFVKENCTDYSLESKTAGIFVSPEVFIGYLPVKSSEDQFPSFIIIRPSEGLETDNSSIVKVRIIVGTYSKADEGIIDCINIMQRIKDKLMAQGTLDKRYRIEYPYKWVVPDEQPYPYWQIEGE